jgi:hypothetical protein
VCCVSCSGRTGVVLDPDDTRYFAYKLMKAAYEVDELEGKR